MVTEKDKSPAPPAAKKRTAWGRIGNILLYGWMFILIFIVGMIILISSLVKGC